MLASQLNLLNGKNATPPRTPKFKPQLLFSEIFSAVLIILDSLLPVFPDKFKPANAPNSYK